MNVHTNSWQPNPAGVQQPINSTVTTTVDNPYQSSNGDSISEHWAWDTTGVYQSKDGTSGSFTAYGSGYSISWAEGDSSTIFTGSFDDIGYYIIKVTATLTYHDDTTNADVGTYTGDGYIGGSAGDLAPPAAAPSAASPRVALRPRVAAAAPAAGTGKGVPIIAVPVAGLQYKDPTTGSFVAVSGTIYVLKNTTLTFKAIPNPSTATFSNGRPVWSGTSGANSTGPTTDIQFKVASASATDYKTVVATSDNAAADKGTTVNVVVADLTLKQLSFSGVGCTQ